MTETTLPDSPNPYPAGFVFGQGEADPRALSLTGLKLRRCLRALKRVKGSVLELGCGGGQYLRGIRRHRPDLALTAIDIDPLAVTMVRAIGEVECRKADAAALPFRNASFAAVIGFDILEHVPDPQRVVAEAARVLRPGGVFHLYVPCEGNPGTIYVRRGHTLKARWGGHVQQFTTAQVREMLIHAGLEPVSERHADYRLTQWFDFAFYQRLDRSPHPERLWAAQALQPQGGIRGRALRWARRLLAAVSWLEGTLVWGAGGAMGVHLTMRKKHLRKEVEP